MQENLVQENETTRKKDCKTIRDTKTKGEIK